MEAWTPFQETRYRARFYFDPNSITMQHGDAHYIFYAANRDAVVLARMELRYSAGDYQVRAEVINDSNSWSSSSWATITDGPHALEIDWRAATAAGANNGGLTFWVDGIEKANFTTIDNDTRQIDYELLGVLEGVDNGTRGTYYIDAFESRRETYIGLANGAPEPPEPPVKTDDLFADGFESGNFSAWSSAATDGGNLSVSTQAAITGTYGMQAVINDNNSMYLRDWNPFEETRYRVRFYFDPNSIAMAHGDAHYIFYAANRDAVVLTRIELRFSAGDYQMRSQVINDSNSWSSSSWVTITDGPHALEIDWRAATAAGANNGGLTFWVDGTEKVNFNTIDNDTRRIDYELLGVLEGVDNGTRGTYYIDAFESRRETYIGLANGAPEPPEPPVKTDDLFADGFESGNFSAWSSAATDGGNLSVSTQAAITGTYGMNAYLNDNNSLYVTDWKPFEETSYRARFYFDPNSLTMTNGDAYYLFYALNRDNVVVARLEFYRGGSLYYVRAQVVDDGSTWSSASWINISDSPHYLEIEWKAATASGANNGVLTYWVDGIQKASFTNIDNDTRRVDYAQMGAVAGVDSGSRGTFYMDAFVSRRETYIGEASLLDTGNVRVVHNVAAKVLAAQVEVQAVPVEESEPQIENPTEHLDTYTPVPSQPVLAHFTPVNSPPEIPLAAQGQPVTTTITYTYDALYRMKQASYSDGTLLKYTYDAVGNRLTEELTGGIVNAYVYDTANRLTSVDGIAYTWDANGNLLSDGVRSYTYDHANRLVGVSGVGQNVSYGYNGLGDRLQQTVNSVTTKYTLDLNAGLTQVLQDGTNTYLYGVSRIAQYYASSPQYFLGDALGSVRQLVDAGGNVTLAKRYQPYGEVLGSAGSGATSYGYTGEWTDGSTGAVYLRSRWYAPSQGRFLTRDLWEENYVRPMSLNDWNYVEANPVSFGDPTGFWRWSLTPSIYHETIENYYEGTVLGMFNPIKQLEYRIPGTLKRPDMFNSLIGGIYEVEPWFLAHDPNQGAAQAVGYLIDLQMASGSLMGDYFGIKYDWSNTSFHLGKGIDWPGKYRRVLANFPMVDLVADYTDTPGLIEYWIEPNRWGLVAISAGLPLLIPNKKMVRPPNWSPGSRAYQPAYLLSYDEACRYVIITVGGTILFLTIAENFLTGGLGAVDDVVTIPTGLLFIYIGSNIAVKVPIDDKNLMP